MKIFLKTLYIASAIMCSAQAVTPEAATTAYKSYSQLKACGTWGVQTTITLKGCNAGSIRDAAAIKTFIKKVCGIINMEQHGASIITHIDSPADKSGYSVAQFLDRGRITIDFDNATNNAYITIFTTSPHEATAVVAFSMNFFNARDKKISTSIIQ